MIVAKVSWDPKPALKKTGEIDSAEIIHVSKIAPNIGHCNTLDICNFDFSYYHSEAHSRSTNSWRQPNYIHLYGS